MRTVTVEVNSILDLVNCSEDYGFSDDVFLSAMYDFCGEVSDQDIIGYAQTLTDEDGYSVEDRREACDRLSQWRKKHLKPVTI